MAPNIIYHIRSERRKKADAKIMKTFSRVARSVMISYEQPQPARFNPLRAEASSQTILATSWITGPMHSAVALAGPTWSNQGR